MKKLLTLGLLATLVIFLAKKASMKHEKWHGLSEVEVRTRLGEKMPSQMPDDKRELVSDKIVEKMRDRGVLLDDDVEIDLVDGVSEEQTTA